MSNLSQNSPENHPAIEAVVGVFDDAISARNAAHAMRGKDIEFRRVSLHNTEDSDVGQIQIPSVIYEPLEEVDLEEVGKGMGVGGGIGAAAGMVLMALPGVGFAAPAAGLLGGIMIGGSVKVDEKSGEIHLPDPTDYQAKLAAGKSLLVITGNEEERLAFAGKLKKFGATDVYQHPAIRNES